MDAKELLARIEKLPEGWRHPDPLGGDVSHVVDLHLRWIAEELCRAGFAIQANSPSEFIVHNSPGYRLWCRDTYPEALISAAEECNKQ